MCKGIGGAIPAHHTPPPPFPYSVPVTQFSTDNVTMRLPLSLPTPWLRRCSLHSLFYSTSAPSPLVNIRSVPAPHTGSIRILSLNNPSSRNAISRKLLAEFSREIDAVHTEGPQGPTRALIIASDIDAAFCAGADLKERKGFTREEYVPSPPLRSAPLHPVFKNSLPLVYSSPFLFETMQSTW